MKAHLEQVIGIQITRAHINLALFDTHWLLLSETQLETPMPSTPGVMTVIIANEIEVIDQKSQATVVGVSIPGVIDFSGRVVCFSEELSGWQDVPLADWLEIRLGRLVSLARNCSFSRIGLEENIIPALPGYQIPKNRDMNSSPCNAHNIASCLEVARFAHERLVMFKEYPGRSNDVTR